MTTHTERRQGLAGREKEAVDEQGIRIIKKKVSEQRAFFMAYAKNEYSKCLVVLEITTITYDDNSTDHIHISSRINNEEKYDNQNQGENNSQNKTQWWNT